MITRDYLHQSGLDKDQLAEILGLKTTASVTKKMDAEMPKRWVRLLNERDGQPAVADSENDARTHTDSPRPIGEDGETDWEQEFRDSDAPNPPEDAETVVGPQRIKLTTVRGYIEQIYGGAAYIADNRGDELAADVIRRYQPDFAEAWINYIESDPRIMEYLEKLMIGTPMGNLIGVHVVAIGSYAFARAAARQVAAAYAEESRNGAGDETATD